MSQWVKVLIISTVVIAWMGFLVAQIIRGNDIPLPFWSVPGATYALLSDKLPSIGFTKKEGTEK